MTTLSTLKLTAALSLTVLCGGCLDDSEDGKASAYTVVTLDAGLPDGAAGDAGPDTPQLTLTCPSAVVTERTLEGFSAQLARGGLPVAGAFVALSPSTGIVVGPEPGGGTTDERGAVAFAFAAPHFDGNTPISLEASTRGADGKVIASARCNFQIVTSGLSFAAAAGTPVGYGAPTPLTVRVHARDVVPRCGDGGGVQVGFADPTRGGVSASSTLPPTATACADVGENGGAATVYLHAGERGGPARVQAMAGSYIGDLDVQVIGAPARLSLSSDLADLALQSAANLTAKVVDDLAQPVRGVDLQLALRCAATPCGDEQVTPTSGTTLADGTARFVYLAGSAPGTAQVTASVLGRPGVFAIAVLRVK